MYSLLLVIMSIKLCQFNLCTQLLPAESISFWSCVQCSLLHYLLLASPDHVSIPQLLPQAMTMRQTQTDRVIFRSPLTIMLGESQVASKLTCLLEKLSAFDFGTTCAGTVFEVLNVASKTITLCHTPYI